MFSFYSPSEENERVGIRKGNTKDTFIIRVIMKRFVVLDLVVTLSYRVEQRGAAASGEEKKNRDAVTSFYVYNRLCV